MPACLFCWLLRQTGRRPVGGRHCGTLLCVYMPVRTILLRWTPAGREEGVCSSRPVVRDFSIRQVGRPRAACMATIKIPLYYFAPTSLASPYYLPRRSFGFLFALLVLPWPIIRRFAVPSLLRLSSRPPSPPPPSPRSYLHTSKYTYLKYLRCLAVCVRTNYKGPAGLFFWGGALLLGPTKNLALPSEPTPRPNPNPVARQVCGSRVPNTRSTEPASYTPSLRRSTAK